MKICVDTVLKLLICSGQHPEVQLNIFQWPSWFFHTHVATQHMCIYFTAVPPAITTQAPALLQHTHPQTGSLKWMDWCTASRAVTPLHSLKYESPAVTYWFFLFYHAATATVWGHCLTGGINVDQMNGKWSLKCCQCVLNDPFLKRSITLSVYTHTHDYRCSSAIFSSSFDPLCEG